MKLNDVLGDSLYEMSNLFPRNTGLPMTIWVSAKGGARHDIRIKAGQNRETSIGLRPCLHTVEGADLRADEMKLLGLWVDKNFEALIDLWNGKIDGVEFARKMEKI